MVYKRKATMPRRKAYSKRKMNIPKSRMTRSSPKSMSFKRVCYVGAYVPNTTTTAGFWQYRITNFAQITNNAEYAALFDQYRINGVKWTFRPKYDSFAGNDTVDVTLPGVTNQAGTNVHVIVDPISNLAPTGTYTSATLNAFLENGRVRSYNGNKAFSIYYKPTIDNQNAVGTTRMKAPWLPTSTTNVTHYGFHMFAQDQNLTGVFGQSWDIFCTFYFQCRGQN